MVDFDDESLGWWAGLEGGDLERFPSTIVHPLVSGMLDAVWRVSDCVLVKVGLALCFATALLAICRFSDFLGNRARDADFLAFGCAVGPRVEVDASCKDGREDCLGGVKTFVVFCEETGVCWGAKNCENCATTSSC